MVYRVPGFEGEQEYRRSLEARAVVIRAELRRLLDAKREVEMNLSELQDYIQVFNPFLIKEGLAPVSETAAFPTLETRIGVPGNRSETMPARREAFRAMSIPQAVLVVLRHGEAMHANDIARAIFDLQTTDDLYRAKQSVVSTLAHGLSAGKWERTGPGTYRLFMEKQALPENPSDSHPLEIGGQTEFSINHA